MTVGKRKKRRMTTKKRRKRIRNKSGLALRKKNNICFRICQTQSKYQQILRQKACREVCGPEFPSSLSKHVALNKTVF